MRYLPELELLQKGGELFRRAVEVTARTVARGCTCYDARLLAPREGYDGPRERRGRLPADPEEREAFVAGLVRWIFAASAVEELFRLILADGTVRFDHPDDTCCWSLNLSEAEFVRLQAAWRAHGLPEDLFYPEDRQVCVPWPGTGWRARLLRALGVRRVYTPRQWARRKADG